ncbi:efflux RND transporter permease subunit [Ferrimonas futtsuensis]|uniref:efflux RND transporter permease subunit n=1 Tax=Ferrimonas futtsuensis TaxID=364764 RepID=UPI0003FC4633|nr:efflux RND transporter permease subunit [Ferrimonas futtsuensis]
MTALLNWFCGRRLAANLMSLCLVILGILALYRLPLAEKPRIDLGKVTVTTQYPGASAEDVEANVTGKLEKELLSVAGTRKFTSRSASGSSNIYIELEPSVKDVASVYQDIRDAVNRVTNLPAGVTDAPLVRVAKSSNLDFMVVGISADKPYDELREQARLLELKLRRVQGISEVHLIDLRDREFWIELEPEQLKRHQLTLIDVADAIAKRNVLITGGAVQTAQGELELITSAQMLQPDELADLQLKSVPQVTLKDVSGGISQGFERRSSIATINGQVAIGFDLRATEEADVLTTSDAVRAVLASEGQRIGEEYQLSVGFDIAEEIRARFDIVKWNGLSGLALVVVVLSLCLNRSVAPWVAFSIPFCLLGTMTVLLLSGQILDSYTMAALILIIGIIVDDAVVVSERISARREAGEGVAEAISKGVQEVYPAIVVSILTTVLAFLPMLFLPGQMGKMLYVLPLTITVALAFSFIDALIVIPAHMRTVLAKPQPSPRPVGQSFTPIIAWALNHSRALLATVVLGSLAAAWGLQKQLPMLFFPTDGAYLVEISAQMSGNQTLEQSWSNAQAIDRMLAATEEVVSWYGEIGESEASWTVSLTPAGHRKVTAGEVVRGWQTLTQALPGILEVEYDVDSGGPPGARPVDLQIAGGSDEARQAQAEAIVQWLEQQPGVIAPHLSMADEVAQMKADPVYPWLSRYGVDTQSLGRTIRLAIEGERVTRVFKEDEEIFYRVVLEPDDREISEMNHLYLRGDSGELVPLDRLVRWHSASRDEVINHYNGERAIRVSASLDPNITDPIATEDALMAAFAGRGEPSVSIYSAGQARETRESMTGLAVAMALALLAIAMLMALLFDRLGEALVGLAVVPAAVAASLLVLWSHGKPLSFFAAVGIIGMTGVVVNNALVLLYHYHGMVFSADPRERRKQLLEGAASRIRPMMVTTLTTVAGLLPLAYGFGGYDNLMSPISLVIGWGVLLSAPLVLLLVPAGYNALLIRRN